MRVLLLLLLLLKNIRTDDPRELRPEVVVAVTSRQSTAALSLSASNKHKKHKIKFVERHIVRLETRYRGAESRERR